MDSQHENVGFQFFLSFYFSVAINWLPIFVLCSCANFEGSGKVFDQSVCATLLSEAWWL